MWRVEYLDEVVVRPLESLMVMIFAELDGNLK